MSSAPDVLGDVGDHLRYHGGAVGLDPIVDEDAHRRFELADAIVAAGDLKLGSECDLEEPVGNLLVGESDPLGGAARGDLRILGERRRHRQPREPHKPRGGDGAAARERARMAIGRRCIGRRCYVSGRHADREYARSKGTHITQPRTSTLHHVHPSSPLERGRTYAKLVPQSEVSR